MSLKLAAFSPYPSPNAKHLHDLHVLHGQMVWWFCGSVVLELKHSAHRCAREASQLSSISASLLLCVKTGNPETVGRFNLAKHR